MYHHFNLRPIAVGQIGELFRKVPDRCIRRIVDSHVDAYAVHDVAVKLVFISAFQNQLYCLWQVGIVFVVNVRIDNTNRIKIIPVFSADRF